MTYIPMDWVNNKNNLGDIYFILNSLEGDVFTPEILLERERITERLKEIGEYTIYNNIKSGVIFFGP